MSASHSASRPHRARPTRPAYRYEASDYEAPTNELNRAQLQERQYPLVGESFYTAQQPQPYIASSSRPASPFTSTAQQQSAYTSSFQPQSSYAPNSPQPPSYQQASYLPLPLQIEANVRMILQQVTTNIQNFEQVVSRQLRGY